MQQMNCFPCICCPQPCYSNDKRENSHAFNSSPQCRRLSGSPEGDVNLEKGNIKGQNFNFRELAVATQNFKQEFLLGEGGFGRVYKGQIQGTDQIVAVKQLDRNGLQGNKEFLVEVLMLSSLHHQNLVNLIGYCADGEQRLLVYEFMPLGSLKDHVLELEPDKKPLDWYTRMSIAVGAARGLEYLHVKANPPVIFRDFKSSHILLDNDYKPKLSDFGLAKLGLLGDKRHASSRVMGTYGYCAPEYARTGHLTMQSDVYSFGVVLLELITGRRVIDNTRPIREQNLVSWAQPIFRDPRRFREMADPLLDSKFPERGLNQAVAIAAMCLQDEATARPMMSDVVTALSFLSVAPESDPTTPTDTQKDCHKSRSSSHSESSQSSGFRSGSKSDRFYEDEAIINSSEATTSDAAWSGGPRSARISRRRDGSASLDYRTGGSANWVLDFTSSDEDPEPDRR